MQIPEGSKAIPVSYYREGKKLSRGEWEGNWLCKEFKRLAYTKLCFVWKYTKEFPDSVDIKLPVKTKNPRLIAYCTAHYKGTASNTFEVSVQNFYNPKTGVIIP